MRILLSNDDGILAPGIKILAQALSTIAEVIVVAPDRDRSGASNSLTLDSPLRVMTYEKDRLGVVGTPTDCIHLALTGLLDDLPDLVVAGINHGSNLGDDVFYSGTVAAAIEGCFLGVPALAVSLAGHQVQHYPTAAQIVKDLVQKLMGDPLPQDTILNINVPDCPLAELAGYEVTRLGRRHKAEPTLESIDPRGKPIYWIGPPGPAADAGMGTDFYAVSQNKVSVTPLHLDLTHYKVFNQVSSWFESVPQSQALGG